MLLIVTNYTAQLRRVNEGRRILVHIDDPSNSVVLVQLRGCRRELLVIVVIAATNTTTSTLAVSSQLFLDDYDVRSVRVTVAFLCRC